MEAIVKLVAEKTGISQPQAKLAVETVASYLKTQLPGGLGAQVESFMKGGGAAGLGDQLKSGLGGKLKDGLGGLFK
jgi:hypothetical protein